MLLHVFIAILSLCTRMSEGIQVTQPAVVVANRHGEASLTCDYRVFEKVEELRFSLLKKSEDREVEICVFSFNTNYDYAVSEGSNSCLVAPSPHNVTFNMSGLQAEDTGMYTCKMEVMYPPPYQVADGNVTFLYVTDLTYQCAQSTEPVEFDMYQWVLLTIFVVLLLYSLIITSILICKKRKRIWDTRYYEQILQSEYKNYHPYYVQF
ncbi:cytotoxic T-lymphocyte protein 4 [Leptodactylus fuscus]